VGALGFNFLPKRKEYTIIGKREEKGQGKKDKDRNRMKDYGRNDNFGQAVATSGFFFLSLRTSLVVVRCDCVLLLYLQLFSALFTVL
jgi:hypothetical protein